MQYSFRGGTMKRSYSDWFVIYLSQQSGIGWYTLNTVVTHRLHELEYWDASSLSAYFTQKQRVDQLIRAKQQFSIISIEQMMADEKRYSYRSILWIESDYPAILRECVQAPWVIYIKGRIELLAAPKVAIVGTRAPSPYGAAITKRIASEWSRLGLTVVSGLAGGIDTLAHQHSIQELGSTLAVLPCGIKHCYPNSNYRLYEQIEKEGLLLSESVQSNTVHKGQFSQRNRIIAGLSYATLVVEGERKSGSMITAKYTQDMDRELFAIPGSLLSSKSEGPNFLIYKGYARILMSSNQLFEDIPWLLQRLQQFLNDAHKKTEQRDIATKKVILSDEENIVLQHIRNHPLSIDDLLQVTGYSYEDLNVILLQLSLYHYIQLHHGSLYIAL